jgi:hypothetical protein
MDNRKSTSCLPALEPDPVIEAYKKDVDRTLLRENLKLTPAQRLAKHAQMLKFVERYRGVAIQANSDAKSSS